MTDTYDSLVQQILEQNSRKSDPDNGEKVEGKEPDLEFQRLLEEERIMERNPSYLAEKERIHMQKMIEEDSPFNHPCQNPENTITLLSKDKCHEADIEFDRDNNTALLNFINIDPSQQDSFIDFLRSIISCLNKESVTTVYQNVTVSDWDTRLKDVDEITLVRHVKQNVVQQEFMIVKTQTSDLINAVMTAMGMGIESHFETA